MISTVSGDQQAILQDILTLYVPGRVFECDPTYSTGSFYKDGRIPQPTYKFDIAPKLPGVEIADCRDLPCESASITSLVFDPPFIHAHGKESEIGQRFSSYPTQHAIRAMYMASLVEFYRVLKTKGVLVFKCQDIVESNKQVFNHCHVWQMANSLGFVDLDLFILTADSRMVGHNHHQQVHARKFHAYFWVFEKGTRR